MLYKSFSVTGVANKTEFDDGLISSLDEPKKIRAVIICVSKYRANIIEGWIETNRILDIYDFAFSTSEDSGDSTPCSSSNKIIRIPIDVDIKPGMIFKIAINSGATPTDIHGAYEYELTT